MGKQTKIQYKIHLYSVECYVVIFVEIYIYFMFMFIMNLQG